MKKFLILLVILALIGTVSASSFESNFKDWKEHYYTYDSSDDAKLTEIFNNLTDKDYLEENDYMQLDTYYSRIYPKPDEVQEQMEKDFKANDLNHDKKLSYKEFVNTFNPIYKYCLAGPDDYDFFLSTDYNHDGKISLEEFEEISYIFTEDSFWDGYDINEICQSEFDNVDHGDGYLDFNEFSRAI